jgi:hypothetical protein
LEIETLTTGYLGEGVQNEFEELEEALTKSL